MIQVNAKVEWTEKQVLAAFDRGTRKGLIAAGLIVLRRTREKLSKIGKPRARKAGTKQAGKTHKFYKDLRRGNKILREAGSLIGGDFLEKLSRPDRRRVELSRKVRDAGGLIDPPGGVPRLRTGNLRRSIIIDPSEPGKVKVGSDMDFTAGYAAAHEFGRKDGSIPARPFLRPSFAETQEQAFNEFARVLGEEFTR